MLLSRAALARLLQWGESGWDPRAGDRPRRGDSSRLASRLAPRAATGHEGSEREDAGREGTAVQDADAELRRLGLWEPPGGPSADVAPAVGTWHSPAWSVDLELHLDLTGCHVVLRSWHRQAGRWVACVSTCDGQTYELAWMDVVDWALELARVAWVDPERLARPRTPDLPAQLEIPWELLVATGEAVRAGRGDLVPALAAGPATHDGGGCHAPSGPTTYRADPGGDWTAADVEQAARWLCTLQDASRGRLCATVLGPGPGPGQAGAAGLVHWTLFPDGWRSLEVVHREDGTPAVLVSRVAGTDLGAQVATRVARIAA